MSNVKINLRHKFYTSTQMQQLWELLCEKENTCLERIEEYQELIVECGEVHVSRDDGAIIDPDRLAEMLGRQRRFFQKIQQAKDRHRFGTIGLCVDTREFMSFERLIASPTTTQSVEAKLEQGKPKLFGVAA